MPPGDFDERLRAGMFAYLDRISNHGMQDVTTDQLNAFEFDGNRISLLQHMRGIRVVSGLPAALSIRTTFVARPEDRPYEDAEGPDGYFRYKWRGTDPDAHDNVALRVAMSERRPLAWFVGVASGRFTAIYPVWLVGEEPTEYQFVLAFDEVMRDDWLEPARLRHPADLALRREYAEATVRRRLHQPVFRQRVLVAYHSQCALCRLRHPELLDAAHIKEDSEGGEPIVPNGVAMCAIHHRAFDSHFLGIRPDYVVEVRPDVLRERDGPTLQHALQGVHRAHLTLPTRQGAWPASELLEERYQQFKLAV
jgi:putative restriction endonuclease